MNKEAIAFGGYIKELEAELQEANDDIHWWKSRFEGASNQNKVLREENERLKKYEKNWIILRKRLQADYERAKLDWTLDDNLASWMIGGIRKLTTIMDELESEGEKEC